MYMHNKIGYVVESIDKLIDSHKRLEEKVNLALLNRGTQLSVPEDESAELELSLLGALPTNSIEEFRRFDGKLKDSRNLRRNVMLVNLSGKTSKNAVQNFMRRIMSDEVALHFSLRGRLQKARFDETNIFCIIESLVGSLFNSKSEIDQAKEAIGDWFSQAKTRLSRRASRVEKNVQN